MEILSPDSIIASEFGLVSAQHNVAIWGWILSDAAEMLRAAQYEFQNVSPGAMDSKKHSAKAKSLARRIIRKFPDSHEATASRSILKNLGERVSEPKAKYQNIHVHRIELILFLPV